MAEVQLLPAYLINGEDELKRETALKRLHARMQTMGDLDFNSDTFDGAQASGAEIVAACNTMPFLIDKRLVVVQNVEAMNKEASEALVSYLGSPSQFCVLCLVSKKLAKNTRLYKAVAKVGDKSVIDCTPRKAYELPDQVRSMAIARGITIDAAAAKRLVELVGDNTVHIDAELEKLALAHAGSQPVSQREVDAMVSNTAEGKWWNLTDAFAARNVAGCVQARSKMPNQSSYQLIGHVVSTLRELLVCHALAARGQGGAAYAAKQLGMPDWKAKKVLANARLWKATELRAALRGARDCERAMKSGSDAETVFMDWVVSSCAKR